MHLPLVEHSTHTIQCVLDVVMQPGFRFFKDFWLGQRLPDPLGYYTYFCDSF